MNNHEHQKYIFRDSRKQELLRQEDLLLSEVESAFRLVLFEKERTSSDVSSLVGTERWHSDAPSIMFALVPGDGVSRNVHAYIKEHGGYLELTVDVNAWRDEFDEGSRALKRKWQHASIGQIRIAPRRPLSLARLQRTLSKAYCTVSNWGASDLVRSSPLSGVQ